MRVLVTGGTGFVGGHLLCELDRAGHACVTLDQTDTRKPAIGDLHLADLRDAGAMRNAIRAIQPEGCIHLAGIAFVPMGWKDPELVFSVNTIGTVNLLEALRAEAPGCRTVVVTSAQIYGQQDRGHPIREDDLAIPETLYAVSKLAADQMALLYHTRYRMPVVTARPSNHIGPGQSEDFVAPSFARQLLDIAAGQQEPVMHVGNLDSIREFLDVRDVVRAYRMLMEKGVPGTGYNVAGDAHIPIREMYTILCRITGAEAECKVDPDRYRPTDYQPRIDASRILADTGWKPDIPLETTLEDVVNSLR